MSDGSASANLVVVLVHGTFARNAPWTQEDALLVRTLAQHFPGVVTRRFLWTGRNGHAARLRAGADCAHFLRRTRAEFPDARIIAISHSHGGNVVLYALRESSPSSLLDGVVCFATPFLNCTPRRPENMLWAMQLSVTSAAALGYMLGVGLLSIAFVFILGAWFASLSDGWQLALGWVVFSGFCYGLINLPRAVWRWSGTRVPHWIRTKTEALQARLQLPQPIRLPLLVATFPGDEAAALLGTGGWLGGIPYRVWAGADRLSRWTRALAPYSLHALIGVGLLVGILSLFLDRELAGLVSVGVMQAVFVPFQVFVWFAVLCLAGMLVFPRCFRSHPLVFGWESIFHNLLVDISPGRVPLNAIGAIVQPLTAPPRRGFALRHSAVYEDEMVLARVVSWIREVVAAHRSETSESNQASS